MRLVPQVVEVINKFPGPDVNRGPPQEYAGHPGGRAKARVATVCLVKVQTPAAETYRIHRRWLPWRRRTRADALDWMPDFPGGDVDFDDDFGLVLVALLLLPFLVILAFVVGEVLLLLLLLPFFVLARSVFGTPWVIEVTRKGKVVHIEAVEGWAASSKRVECLATGLRQGGPPPEELWVATAAGPLADVSAAEDQGGQAEDENDQKAKVGRAVTKGQ